MKRYSHVKRAPKSKIRLFFRVFRWDLQNLRVLCICPVTINLRKTSSHSVFFFWEFKWQNEFSSFYWTNHNFLQIDSIGLIQWAKHLNDNMGKKSFNMGTKSFQINHNVFWIYFDYFSHKIPSNVIPSICIWTFWVYSSAFRRKKPAQFLSIISMCVTYIKKSTDFINFIFVSHISVRFLRFNCVHGSKRVFPLAKKKMRKLEFADKVINRNFSFSINRIKAIVHWPRVKWIIVV